MSIRRFPFGSSFGVMQGRLSPQSPLGYQAFPWATWEKEFQIASQFSLEHIEWVLDAHDFYSNPLIAHPSSILECSRTFDVGVPSVCADFLMENPLCYDDPLGWAKVEKTMDGMVAIGAKVLVWPCVDGASLLNEAKLHELQRVLPRALELAQSRFIQIAIESDLPPRRLLNLVEIWNHPNLTINYDSGNSASLGYSFDDEIELYGRYISDLHVKDRTKNGGSVEIGKGAVDFQRLVRFLSSGSFDGIVTMQAFRDQDGIQVFSRQLFSLENKAFEMGIRG